MSDPLPSVLVVEDHARVTQLMVRFLREQGNVEVWGAVLTAEEALAKLAEASQGASGSETATRSADGQLPDLVLVDVSLPGMSGIELVGELSRLYPEVPCLMLSAHPNLTYVQKALDNGARGYVIKGYPEVILEGIRRVLAGEIYLSAEIGRMMDR